jgi:hypothetical protein
VMLLEEGIDEVDPDSACELVPDASFHNFE